VLSGTGHPIGIADYQLVRALPVTHDSCLPGIEEIKAETGRTREKASLAAIGARQKDCRRKSARKPHPKVGCRRWCGHQFNHLINDEASFTVRGS